MSDPVLPVSDPDLHNNINDAWFATPPPPVKDPRNCDPFLSGTRGNPQTVAGRRSSTSRVRPHIGAVLFNLSFLVNLAFYVVLAFAGWDAMGPGGGHSKLPHDWELGWFEALGDCVSGDRDWERRVGGCST